ncbi:MAG: hypothetical protein ACYSR6_14585, partial [Planctomycetota bacterium]
MSRKEIFRLWVVVWVVAVVGSTSIAAAPTYSAQTPIRVLPYAAPTYTAKILIRVLPYAETDPMTIEAPAVDAGLQERFRRSMAT